MMENNENKRLRILIVDDEPHILKTYGEILNPAKEDGTDQSELDSLHESIFGSGGEGEGTQSFELAFASQGKEAVEMVRQAGKDEQPFALVFLDMRMPPGQSGFLTSKQIRMLDPHCNIVIVTAHSDVEVTEIATAVKPADKLYYLRKPFYPQEIQQFAFGLVSKWQTERQLEALLEERTMRLARTNVALHEEMDMRQEVEKEMDRVQQSYQEKEEEAKVVSRSIDVLFRKKFNAQKEFEEVINTNISRHVLPYVKKLRECEFCSRHASHLEMIEKNLKEVTSPFMHNLSNTFHNLTPDEINVAQMICDGRKSKEIAEVLGKTTRTINFYREQLRNKLGLTNTSKSLKHALMELQVELNKRAES